LEKQIKFNFEYSDEICIRYREIIKLSLHILGKDLHLPSQDLSQKGIKVSIQPKALIANLSKKGPAWELCECIKFYLTDDILKQNVIVSKSNEFEVGCKNATNRAEAK
jgi:hypothetical protein